MCVSEVCVCGGGDEFFLGEIFTLFAVISLSRATLSNYRASLCEVFINICTAQKLDNRRKELKATSIK